MRTYYTAVGNFRRKRDRAGQAYPVIIVNRQEYMVDRQEMALWICLNWRITSMEQAREHYEKLEQSLYPYITRTFENCLKRLEVRGLVVSGSGDTDFEALYDLLGGLYVIPISESIPLRAVTFLKIGSAGWRFCIQGQTAVPAGSPQSAGGAGPGPVQAGAAVHRRADQVRRAGGSGHLHR